MNQPTLDITPTVHSVANWATGTYPVWFSWTRNTVGFFLGLSMILSALFFLGIIYCVERLKVIRKKESEIYDLKVEESYETTVPGGDTTLAKRWDSVKTHIESTNQNDWRQAILDADIMLDDLLNKMEYHGESVGEKLKRVEKPISIQSMKLGKPTRYATRSLMKALLCRSISMKPRE